MLTIMTGAWVRDFILKLHNIYFIFRTNSKQGLKRSREDRKILTPPSLPHCIPDEGVAPLKRVGSHIPKAKKSFPKPSRVPPSTDGPVSFSFSFCVLGRLQLLECTMTEGDVRELETVVSQNV